MPEPENEYHERCLGLIEKHGWMAQAIAPGEDDPDDVPEFTYSVGAFRTYGIPELIVFSLPQDVRHSLLTMYIETCKAGTPIETNKRLVGWLNGYDVVLIDVDQTKSVGYFGTSIWYNDGPDFPALQLIWPTTRTRSYPWDETWPENDAWRQPLLGPTPQLPLTSPGGDNEPNPFL